ncbi:ribosome recycling factor [Saccharicrinis carchari]|uniref:Ribosome-recycling factor n=1 Tax=Saccharicrinis carchari TaxID=1168039 RepID=A0A521CV10_SACCC|nr:ribosome recycling factor [Saccharicrinis carchari]SMO62490.1 ribosome recycling factor [Saccharicrinis carchari]
MTEEIELLMDVTKEKMDKTIEHLDHQLIKVRAGKANPGMLEGIMVDYYGSMTPLQQVANINTPDPRTIVIQPWEKAMIVPIEKAIMLANLGLNPENNGELVRINVPPLTEERRKDLVKQVKREAEEARISLRNLRREANDELKKMLKDGLPEDMEKDAVADVQKLTDSYSDIIEERIKAKEKDILTI